MATRIFRVEWGTVASYDVVASNIKEAAERALRFAPYMASNRRFWLHRITSVTLVAEA
ncbi:MAG: hypothetical protein QXJ74_05280 [Nitrososphaera sp.]